MKGIKHVVVKNRHVHYRFDLFRNITIIRGNSGTGKTTLYDMIAEFARDGQKSGINLSAPCPCVVLEDDLWEMRLERIRASIVFVDEGAGFLKTREFAKAIQRSDNYFVFFTREDLHELPYSVDEIYEIKTSGKYHTLRRMYPEKSRIFTKTAKNFSADLIVAEDSNAGFDFLQSTYEPEGVTCLSAEGNTNIFSLIDQNKDKQIFVSADGAAFGSEIDRVLKTIGSRINVRLYLPESFEWIILESGLINQVENILNNPSEFIDSEIFFSWERFFTKLLMDKTAGSYLEYRKNLLNENYLHEAEKAAIVDELPKIQ